MGTGVFEEFTGAGDGLLAELLVQPAINYALVANRVPLVRHLVVTNTGRDPITDLRIRLRLTGPYGPVTEVWEHGAGRLAPGGTVRWEEFAQLRPDPEQLRGADEAYPVDYRLTLTATGREPLELVAPSRLLAHNEWFNAAALYDSLAAFVQPNTPAVQGVLRAAAQILLQRTGTGALQGYQAGTARASQIAGAVYEALRQLGLHYQELPPSFETTGQKVRSTADVLDGRAGNCVDLAVTYAACLEAAGLHPLVWLTANHAFGGFLLADERLASPAVTETNLILAMVRAGRAVPVELTSLGAGTLSQPFPIAVEQALAYFRERGDDLAGVVDVHLAHRSGIQPLPTAALAAPRLANLAGTETQAAVPAEAAPWASGDELTLVLPVEPVAPGAIDLPSGAARELLAEQTASLDDEAPDPGDGAPARVQRWRKSLLDLSLRNPLLNLPARGRGLELHVPAGSLALLDDLVHDGKPIQVVPQDEITGVQELAGAQRAQELPAAQLAEELAKDRRIYGAVTTARYVTVMRALQRDARTMLQETGSNYLYLTLGTLVHHKSDGSEAHAPLFLLPVRIEGGTGRRPYALVVDGAEVASPNYCLIEWLRVKHGVEIPELQRPIRDEHGIDIPRTLAAVHARLVDNRLNYRLDERASLRLLQFSTFQMWRDLTDNWPAFLANPVVRHLVEGNARFVDPMASEPAPLDEAALHLPIPADGSQMQAIVLAERGHTFVLEGPPGTGKSQTITNLIARAMSAGRTVLFVAEKQAALDVVKRRLQQIGLAPFALDLHGRKQSMREIREQLRAAMEQPAGGDELGWQVAEGEYRTRLAPLSGYPGQVHRPNAAGLSLWSAYETRLAYGPGVGAPIPVSYLSAPAEQRAAVERELREIPALLRSIRLAPGYPWAISGQREVDQPLEALTEIAEALDRDIADLAGDPALSAVLAEVPTPAAVAELMPVARYAVAGALPDREQTQRASDPRWDVAVAALRTDLSRFHQEYAAELATVRPDLLTAPNLATWQARAHEAAGRWFGKKRRLAAIAGELASYLRPGATLDAAKLPAFLDRLVAARAEAGRLFQLPAQLGGVKMPAGWLPTNPDAESQLGKAIDASLAARSLLARSPQLWDFFAAPPQPAQVELLSRTANDWRAWLSALGTGEPELARWAQPHWLAAWRAAGGRWSADLREAGLYPLHRWAELLRRTDVLADAGLREFRDRLLDASVPAEGVEAAYHRGMAAVSIGERQQAGDLMYFDPEQHDDRITRYARAADELRAALPEHLPAVLVGRRALAAQSGERLAELATELRRKRGGRSFRELFTAYPDEILALTPCVLVSPASAAFFLAPGAATFDLVVFDEASQIRVAEAVGAMGRGRATVIVGDSKQMPPSSIMQSSHQTDDESLPALDSDGEPVVVPEDLDSILSESVESGVPQRWLSWHYRSRDESLIAFSNRFYYEGKLSSLPGPGSAGAGISWRRLDGRFDRGRTRVNMTEAEAIVEEITARLADPATAEESIGVVTFNLQQRDLILNLLEESTDPLVRKALTAADGEPIFVKNLENVQGDERDVVLFSLAFAKDPKTGLLPLNFGPLSQVGGERRLNVAITRARRQVVLFASFDPKDIDLSRTSAVGTAHLRAYCELAAEGSGRLGDITAPNAARERVRDEVALALRERGFDVATGYGLSDFTVDVAVRAPGAAQWQVAVLLDSPRWAARPTVADRDGAPELLRTVMGWPEVVRCWLPSWIRGRAELLDRVAAAVERASAAAAASPPEPTPAGPTPTDPTPTEPGPPEPGPTEAGPTEPGPTEPGPAEPIPTEPGPAEPSAAEPGVRVVPSPRR
jgi:Protein of unknown function (DUF4011)/AAA domain/REase_MTES_1575